MARLRQYDPELGLEPVPRPGQLVNPAPPVGAPATPQGTTSPSPTPTPTPSWGTTPSGQWQTSGPSRGERPASPSSVNRPPATTPPPTTPPIPPVPNVDAAKQQIDLILRKYQHSPLNEADLNNWLTLLSSGKVTLAQFEQEVQRTMARPDALKYNYGAPNSPGAGGPAGPIQPPQYNVGGINPDKWFNPEHKTPKYTVLRILSKYPPTPEGLQQAKAELEAVGIQVVGKDKILHPEAGVIDVGEAFGAGGGKSWQWLPVGDNPGSALGGPGGGGPNGAGGFGGFGGGEGGFGFDEGYGMGGGNGDLLQQSVNQALLSFLKGDRGPLGDAMNQSLIGLINRGGELDPKQAALKFEQQREMIDRARKAQMSEASAELANRGTLSLPGIEQGPTNQTITNIEKELAPIFSGAVRDIMINESDQSSKRLMDSLQIAAGVTRDEGQLILGAINTQGEQQKLMAEIALRSLDQNMQWNMFLADFGLRREQIMSQVESGQVESLIPLLMMFVQAAQMSANGKIA